MSDERAAEVARLASDRERLLSEVVETEERERARLAESLHDGPVQRFAAMRQDMAEGVGPDQLADHLDAALAETRAMISAFHPVMVRELGFEASLRAAVAPFPAAQIRRADRRHHRRRPVPREHAPAARRPGARRSTRSSTPNPSAIDLSVRAHDGRIVIEVSDDGVGIDTVDAGRAVQAGHLGLAMVRRRVEDAVACSTSRRATDGGTRTRCEPCR